MIYRVDITYDDLPARTPFSFDGRDLILNFQKNGRTGGVSVEIWEDEAMIYSGPLLYGSPTTHVVSEDPLPGITVLRKEDFSDSLQDVTISEETLGKEVFIYISDGENE